MLCNNFKILYVIYVVATITDYFVCPPSVRYNSQQCIGNMCKYNVVMYILAQLIFFNFFIYTFILHSDLFIWYYPFVIIISTSGICFQ